MRKVYSLMVIAATGLNAAQTPAAVMTTATIIETSLLMKPDDFTLAALARPPLNAYRWRIAQWADVESMRSA